MKLNLGCGSVKLPQFTNLDIDEALKPDLVCDFTKEIPFPDGSIETVLLFHTIEHIEKRKHLALLLDIRRVLQPEGELFVSFPEFSVCIENWKTNYLGKRHFWEATIFGRQSSPSDYHVCAMDKTEFIHVLKGAGYRVEFAVPELKEPHNTVIKATPDLLLTYSDQVRETIWTGSKSEPKS